MRRITTSEPAPRHSRPWLAIVMGTAIAGGIGATVVVPRIESAAAVRAERAREPRLIETVVVQAAPDHRKCLPDGTAVPIASATLHAPAPGVIDSVIADIGEKVIKGQILAKLHLGEAPTGPAQDAVVAPFDGIVTHRNCEVGATVAN